MVQPSLNSLGGIKSPISKNLFLISGPSNLDIDLVCQLYNKPGLPLYILKIYFVIFFAFSNAFSTPALKPDAIPGLITFKKFF